MYRAILAAIDLEDEAGSTLVAQRCRSLVSSCGADDPRPLHLIGVRIPLPSSYTQYLPEAWEENQRRDAEQSLRSYAEANDIIDAVGSVHAPAGSVSREVVTLARSLSADVICVAAHRMDLKRMILGTNTHAIVRDAPCDVLVFRERDR